MAAATVAGLAAVAVSTAAVEAVSTVVAEWVAAPPSVAAGWEAVSEAAASAPRRLERLAQQRFAAAPWRLMRSHPVVSRAVISTAAASIMDSTMVADLG